MFKKFAAPMVVIVLASTLGLLAMPAGADPIGDDSRVTIDYRGVDLASSAGRQTLDRRIGSAIAQICGEAIYGTRDEHEVLDKCRREMRVRVEPMVAKALLTAAERTVLAR